MQTVWGLSTELRQREHSSQLLLKKLGKLVQELQGPLSMKIVHLTKGPFIGVMAGSNCVKILVT
jgi:hypothetical protein